MAIDEPIILLRSREEVVRYEFICALGEWMHLSRELGEWSIIKGITLRESWSRYLEARDNFLSNR